MKRTHKKHVFLFYKKYSIILVIFLFLIFSGKSVKLRDVLVFFFVVVFVFLFQDLLRITVIDFVKTLVV